MKKDFMANSKWSMEDVQAVIDSLERTGVIKKKNKGVRYETERR